MSRRYGRAPKGKRLRAGIPHGHWKTTTFVAGLRLSGMVAPMVLDGPINGVAFQAYVDQVLVPTLKPGDMVAMNNLCSHKGSGACRPSKPPVQAFPTSRFTARTSTRSRRLSRS